MLLRWRTSNQSVTTRCNPIISGAGQTQATIRGASVIEISAASEAVEGEKVVAVIGVVLEDLKDKVKWMVFKVKQSFSDFVHLYIKVFNFKICVVFYNIG